MGGMQPQAPGSSRYGGMKGSLLQGPQGRPGDRMSAHGHPGRVLCGGPSTPVDGNLASMPWSQQSSEGTNRAWTKPENTARGRGPPLPWGWGWWGAATPTTSSATSLLLSIGPQPKGLSAHCPPWRTHPRPLPRWPWPHQPQPPPRGPAVKGSPPPVPLGSPWPCSLLCRAGGGGSPAAEAPRGPHRS